MKKKSFSSLKKAFTLLELLVVTTVILILIAYFTAASSSGIEKAKIAKQQFQLAKIADAIRLFEQDWGELPPDLSLLINPIGLVQYAESKGANIAPKAYLDAPKNHYIRLSWMNASKPANKYTELKYFTAIPITNPKDPKDPVNDKHYLYDLSKLSLSETNPIILQSLHHITYALLDIWGTPLYYKPYSNGKFALFSAGPDTYAAITNFSGTFTTSEDFSVDEIKNPLIEKPFAIRKEVLVLLDPKVTEIEMSSQNVYNKDNIIYSPLQ